MLVTDSPTTSAEAKTKPRWSRDRMLANVAIALGLLILVLRSQLWTLLNGQRMVIAECSMAPALLGDFVDVECEACRFRIAGSIKFWPGPDALVVCPNCGQSQTCEPPFMTHSDQVFLDRGAYWFLGPSRGDIVAFRTLDDPNKWLTKRIVGLPGEQISLKNGDVLIDGKTWQKPWPLCLEQRVLVHDDSFRPSGAASVRWVPEKQDSRWKPTDRGHAFSSREKKDETSDEFDWLVYRHRLCYPTGFASANDTPVGAPIDDHDPFTQTFSTRVLPIRDVLIDIEFEAAPSRDSAQVAIAVCDASDRPKWTFVFLEDAAQIIDSKGSILASESYEQPRAKRMAKCGFVDGLLRLSVDNQLQTVAVGDNELQAFSLGKTAFMIGAKGAGAITLNGIQIYRDIHYGSRATPDGEWTASGPLAADEYLVLGDNPAVSEDSRDWIAFGVKKSRLLGRVTKSIGR